MSNYIGICLSQSAFDNALYVIIEENGQVDVMRMIYQF